MTEAARSFSGRISGLALEYPETAAQGLKRLDQELERALEDAVSSPTVSRLARLSEAVQVRSTAALALQQVNQAYQESVSALIRNLLA